MGGKDEQPGAIHVDECHHGEVMGRGRLLWGPYRGLPFPPVSESRLIAMMAVRNDELLVGHFPLNMRDHRLIRGLPYLMADSELVVHVDRRPIPEIERPLNLCLGVGIQHEDVSEV